MSKIKSKFQPYGKWVSVKTDKIGEQTTTEAGIIYTEKPTGRYVVSTVVAVGDALTEDIKAGDTVYWDSKEFKGDEFDGMHLVHQDWVALVDR
jgi:co-chaperonin GroES (HSP10)